MRKEELDACWRDPRNRRWGVYYCKADPRVIVPKRFKWMGWTINAAHASAIPVTLLMLALLAGPAFLVAQRGAGVGTVLLTVALSISIICVLCAHLSSRTS
jgi:hypothetical protein